MSDIVGWGLALGVAALVSWIAYPSSATATLRPLLIALRGIAVLVLIALLLDLPIGRARPPAALVALDASASWIRTGDTASWRAAVDSATSSAATTQGVLLFGDSARNATIPASPSDRATLIAPVLQRATAAGQRVVIITDGALDDADALSQAVGGSRLIVLPNRRASDLALFDLRAPAEARAGDTVTLSARIVADAPAAGRASVQFMLDAVALGDAPVPDIVAGGETVVERQVVIPAGDSVAVLRAIVTGAIDAQPRNDTIAVAFRRGARQRVVIISTAPDADVRDVATALRANVALPTDVYFRIAPGRWLRDGTFSPIEESSVRAAVRGATLAVLHGDTTVMGSPSALGTRALLLLSPPVGDAPELLVRAAPASPLQAALAGIAVESLPPLFASSSARGGVTSLSAAPGMSASGATPIVSAIDGDVRRVLVTAAGYSRWRARGGVSEAAFQALVGGATDWLLGARGVRAAATLVLPVQRAGTAVRWHRGGATTVAVRLVRDGDRTERRDTLRFADGAEAVMPALDAGVWRGVIDGTSIVVPVSASREWLPTASMLRSGTLNGEAVSVRRGARSLGWFYLASVLLLAAEWLLRRRAGLR